MSQPVQPYREPEATPVGHSGIRVDVHERPALSVNGWFGVLLAAGCGVIAYFVAQGSTPLWAIVPSLAGWLIATSLVIVRPGRRRSCASSAATSARCARPACRGSCR